MVHILHHKINFTLKVDLTVVLQVALAIAGSILTGLFQIGRKEPVS
jgi:hypothetical protein